MVKVGGGTNTSTGEGRPTSCLAEPAGNRVNSHFIIIIL